MCLKKSEIVIDDKEESSDEEDDEDEDEDESDDGSKQMDETESVASVTVVGEDDEKVVDVLDTIEEEKVVTLRVLLSLRGLDQLNGGIRQDSLRLQATAFMGVAKAEFDTAVEASMKCARRCGNMYTASLYGGLSSLISAVEPKELLGKRFSMFAYGSGMAASFFVIRVKGDTSELREKLDLKNRLAAIKVVPCQEYVDALKIREENHNAVDYTPSGNIDNIWPGGYYLEHIDSKYRRKYIRKPVSA